MREIDVCHGPAGPFRDPLVALRGRSPQATNFVV